ncbi:predicted GPI-anchored protein 58 [Miscanthus floridulus]|uniref:predicted GPI-anchored protein 58 n=1 Tax=Miscanthus floridulus TaxID=154761 RepID=UPI0034577442
MEVAPGASASSPAPPGRGGEADPGPAVARSGAEADTPEARALGKRAISPVGSVAVAEQVAVEATPPPPQRTEGAPGSAEDRPAPMDMDATPLPPPPPLRMRFAVVKRGPPHSK